MTKLRIAITATVLMAVSGCVSVYPSGCVQIPRALVQPDWTYRTEIKDWRRNGDGELMGYAVDYYSDLWLPTFYCAWTEGRHRH